MMRYCCAIVLLVVAAGADPMPSKPVHFAACAAAGVEHGCVVAKGDDGKLYNVTGAVPGLKAGQWLQGTAMMTNRASYCMQGATIDGFTPDAVQRPGMCEREN
jgi:hypothetical protein